MVYNKFLGSFLKMASVFVLINLTTNLAYGKIELKNLFKALKTIEKLYENMYKIVYFEILKKIISKNGKMSNQKLGNIKNLGNLG